MTDPSGLLSEAEEAAMERDLAARRAQEAAAVKSQVRSLPHDPRATEQTCPACLSGATGYDHEAVGPNDGYGRT